MIDQKKLTLILCAYKTSNIVEPTLFKKIFKSYDQELFIRKLITHHQNCCFKVYLDDDKYDNCQGFIQLQFFLNNTDINPIIDDIHEQFFYYMNKIIETTFLECIIIPNGNRINKDPVWTISDMIRKILEKLFRLMMNDDTFWGCDCMGFDNDMKHIGRYFAWRVYDKLSISEREKMNNFMLRLFDGDPIEEPYIPISYPIEYRYYFEWR